MSYPMIKLYLINNYRSYFPHLSSSDLTDKMLEGIFREEGVEDAVVLRTGNGKPYEKLGRIKFSVSHSGDTFVCATASFDLGVDIQDRCPREPQRLAERFFSDVENDILSRAGARESETFLRIWTRKEALIKYLGSTMSRVISSETVLYREDVDFIDLSLAGGLICSLCIPPGEDPDTETILWTPETER